MKVGRAASNDGKSRPPPADANNPSIFKCIFAASVYAFSASAIILFNKGVLTTYNFRSPLFMCLCHIGTSLFFVVLLKWLGFLGYKDFDWATCRRVMPISLLFVSNIVCGQLGTRLVSVPMFTTLRRLCAPTIIIFEYIILSTPIRQRVVIPVGLLILGAIVSGENDLYFDPVGYAVVILNDVITAVYLVSIKKTGLKLDKFEIIFYNSLVCTPILAVLCFLKGEFQYVAEFPSLYDKWFRLFYGCSCLLAFFVNVSTVFCTTVNSALTTSVVGQTKNVAVAGLGAILFHDFHSNFMIICGIGISICGSFLYAYVKYQSSQQKAKDDKKGEYQKVDSKAAV